MGGSKSGSRMRGEDSDMDWKDPTGAGDGPRRAQTSRAATWTRKEPLQNMLERHCLVSGGT